MPDSGRAEASVPGEPAAGGLGELRDAIDRIDRAILERLNERAEIVQAVGRLKETTGTSVYAASRERDIVAELSRLNSGPFPTSALAPVFREIISATRSLEDVTHVAYMGPEATFSHLAAVEQFGEMADLESFASIADVFAAVARRKVALGVVPAENSTEGIVTATFDAFVQYVDEGVTICGEAMQRISHFLVSKSGRKDGVLRVASHPQPLAQCRGWLDRNLPGVDRIETASTSAAAQLALEDDGVAAIGSAMAARVYGLSPIESFIEDQSDNTTRFLVIGTQPPRPSGNDLTSAVFTIRKDEAGGLYRLLEPFAESDVNLTSIQERPMAGKPWEYLFFIDLEGHLSEERVSRALAAAGELANSTRILGSFPRSPKLGPRRT